MGEGAGRADVHRTWRGDGRNLDGKNATKNFKETIATVDFALLQGRPILGPGMAVPLRFFFFDVLVEKTFATKFS